MNRKEFMARLEALLQNVPADEREAAMEFYNDYFDDAGQDRETDVILELESPEKVAASIRENISGQSGDMGRYTEHGYESETEGTSANGISYHDSEHQGENATGESKGLSKGVIIALVVVGCLIALPITSTLAGGLVGAIFGIVVAAISIFICLVLAAFAVFIAGVVLFIIGITQIAVLIPNALALCGSGLVLMAFGAAGTVGAIKLCFIVYPAMFRGAVGIGRRIIHGEGAA